MFALIESIGSPEFYTGRTYIYHGAYYPTVSYHKEEAKYYIKAKRLL